MVMGRWPKDLGMERRKKAAWEAASSGYDGDGGMTAKIGRMIVDLGRGRKRLATAREDGR